MMQELSGSGQCFLKIKNIISIFIIYLFGCTGLSCGVGSSPLTRAQTHHPIHLFQVFAVFSARPQRGLPGWSHLPLLSCSLQPGGGAEVKPLREVP